MNESTAGKLFLKGEDGEKGKKRIDLCYKYVFIPHSECNTVNMY